MTQGNAQEMESTLASLVNEGLDLMPAATGDVGIPGIRVAAAECLNQPG